MTAPARRDWKRETEELKAAANANMARVLSACRVTGTPRGRRGYIAMCDPVQPETQPSLVIFTQMPGGLSFKRYGGSGAGGDIFGFVAYMNGWYWEGDKGFKRACEFLRDLLGFEKLTPAQRENNAKAARFKQQRDEKINARNEEAERRRAFEIWREQCAPIEGTLGEVYLRDARGIDLQALPRGPRGGTRIPSVLRFMPRAKHIDRKGVETFWPCMVAGCVDFRAGPHFGKIRAIHRTFLALDGSGKAPVAPARKVWPGFEGLVIPLWRGDSDLSVGEANEHGLCETLRLSEGIENALSLVIGNPARRTWAFIALDNLGNVPLPPSIDGVMVARENDWKKLQAVEAYERGRALLGQQGRPIEEVVSFYGSDPNDTLMEE